MSGKEQVSTAEELESVLRFITQNDRPLLENFITQNDRPLLENFTINLPPHLLKCLSYFKLFPKDFKIPARRLIALWIAEDLVEVTKHNTETFEEVAYKYLSELIDRCMIQVIEKKQNGEVKTCSLPYALQQLTPEDMRAERVTDQLNKNDPTFSHIHGELSSSFQDSYRHILSILSFDTREGNKPGEEIGTFLRKGLAGGFFFQLQVLDLERVFRPELPNTIGKLSKLRYLGLRWTYLESLPASIGNLHNLQTLDVKHTYVHSLPGSIWKLQKLRHLYLNQSHGSKFVHQQPGRSLKNLQTLWGIFVDKDSPLKEGLDKLINLRKLGLAFQLDLSEQKGLADGIVKLKHLQSLRMRSIGEMGEPNDLIDMPLSDLENLVTLNLFGKLGPSNPIIDTFPESLTDLTLSATSLSHDPMPKLEKLPNLKVVCFYSNSYTGREMTCSMLGFPKLVVLKLWKLEQLEDWVVEDNAMQNLRELEIRSCKKLNVPGGLKHLKTLTEFKLTNMPKQFAATIAKTKGQLWDDLVHSPTVIAVNWEDSTDKS
ncbi:PREDICTED: probable disease resistance protein RF9-like [Fragaria vesca subsp. vesca]